MLSLPTREARSTPGGSSQSSLQKEVMDYTSPNIAGDTAGSPENSINCLSQNRDLDAQPLDLQPRWLFAASKITSDWETWLSPPPLTLLIHFPT